MPHPPRKGDLTIYEVSDRARCLIVDGHDVYLKWTCPSCGERVTADDKLSLVLREGRFPAGTPIADLYNVGFHVKYLHTARDNGDPCMYHVNAVEHVFGFTVVTGMHPPYDPFPSE